MKVSISVQAGACAGMAAAAARLSGRGLSLSFGRHVGRVVGNKFIVV